jgi:hypothetical protein
MVTLLNKTYDGESVVDIGRDVSEAFDKRFTPEIGKIPQDEYGIQLGTFRVTITWEPE